jgi:hypothetical protein
LDLKGLRHFGLRDIEPWVVMASNLACATEHCPIVALAIRAPNLSF